ncbi:GDP-mannose 4,6-dehydratase [Amniculibacterium aquaticum]|uniref:GDP-mannose 4,6-dehydratase n=1 Tax=Amniculibacterium aquaticum TaxID=2479858 RepID=UPI000F5AC0D4|nr:GDP-mannose 4,6-dehydratase [Amniculibacterium aquaticum]
MTYLVTGGSGFIGSHLVEHLLENGHSVINIDNFDTFYKYQNKILNTLESIGQDIDFQFEEREKDLQKLEKIVNSDNYTLYYQDIRDLNGLRNIFKNHSIDMVIHLAALAGVRPSIERPLDYEEVNLRGSMNLWELCKEFDVKKFVCASSSSVYGNNDKVPFSENDPVDRPISPYAATKKCGEIMGHVYHHLYHLDLIFLRFFTVYGPRQRPDLAIRKFTQSIIEGDKIPFYGDGKTARDYTFVNDIIDGVLKSISYLESNTKVYEIINLGESEVVSLDRMLSTIETELGKKADINPLPMQPGDVQRTNADIDKAKTMIGYAPDTTFQNGIKKFVEWFLRKQR